MDTKALRQKILDLAIHGKLVPQDPNDEPASVLLERIRAEKERLIKEGKIKKGKKSAKTSDKPHYPFELPKGWVWCKLEDYVFSVTDGDHQAPPKVPKGIPFLVISNIADGSLDFSNTRYVPEEYYEKIQMERKPKRGDILFSVTGSYGIVVNIKTDRLFCFQRHIGLIKPTISNEYLSFVLMSNYIKSLCDKLATGTAQKTVGLDTLRSLYVPIAPIEEQERIVAKIKHLLLQISFLEAGKGKLVAAIKQAKSKILDLAIHGKLVSQDPNDEPASELLKRINPKAEIITDNGHYQKLPVGWCMTNIESLFEAVSAKRVLKSEWKNKGIPFYRAREIVQLSKEGIADKDLFVSKEHYSELKEKYGVPSCDDIMISAVGSIGYTYIVKKGDVFYYKDASVLCLKNTNHWNPTFFKIWLASPFLQEQMYKNSKGTTVNTITLEKLKGYVIPLPPITEQHRIVSKVEDLFSQLDNIASSL